MAKQMRQIRNELVQQFSQDEGKPSLKTIRAAVSTASQIKKDRSEENEKESLQDT